MLSEACGFHGSDIMFSSNDTPEGEFTKVRQLEGIINLDDITMILTAKYSLNPLFHENAFFNLTAFSRIPDGHAAEKVVDLMVAIDSSTYTHTPSDL